MRGYLIRHSLSTYQNMRNVIESEQPEGRINYDNQVFDVPQKGVELAESKAEELFQSLSPETDRLYFVSSNEARAIDTANIYRRIAKEKGFKISKSYTGDSKYAETIGEQEIRVLDWLSLYPPNVLLHSIYNSNPEKVFTIDWNKIGLETKSAWDESRKIIEADDRGSWGGNFAAHSTAVKKILRRVSPKEKSAEDMHKENFSSLLRFARIIAVTIQKNCKNLVVVAFGHENYLLIALEKYFSEHSIGNCESICFEIANGSVKLRFRGKEAIL